VNRSLNGSVTSRGPATPQAPGPERPAIAYTRDKLGKLLKVGDLPQEGLVTPELMQLMALFSWTIFPDKAVKPGDSWEAEFDNPAVKGKKLTVKTTFVVPPGVGVPRLSAIVGVAPRTTLVGVPRCRIIGGVLTVVGSDTVVGTAAGVELAATVGKAKVGRANGVPPIWNGVPSAWIVATTLEACWAVV